MSTFIEKAQYFRACLRKRVAGQPLRCPSCCAPQSQVVARKYLVSELRSCHACKLLFRYPLDTEQENLTFYQADYSAGFTTDCPSDRELASLLATRFVGHQKDYAHYIRVLQAVGLPAGADLLDYGCSWGYGTWQLQQAGFKVHGFEISKPRARYAREQMRLHVSSDASELRSGYRCFFSAHVLEHVPAVSKVIDLAKQHLAPGGLFIAFTPNGSRPFRARFPKAFRNGWGRVHPNYLTDEFYWRVFGGRPLLLASSPYDYSDIASWDRKRQTRLDLSGKELLCATVLG